MFDLELDYEAAKKHVQELGWDNFLEFLCYLFPELSLFQVSQAWFKDRKYIGKAKGAKGDILIGWR